MSPGTEPEKPIRKQINQLFEFCSNELRKLGFTPKEDSLKWLDLVFLSPQLNWKDASKLILFAVRECRKEFESGKFDENFDVILRDRTVENFYSIYNKSMGVTQQSKSATLTPQVLSALTIVILVDNIAYSYLQLDLEKKSKIIQLSLDYFEDFFDIVLKLAEKLPDDINQIMSGLKKECIEKYLFEAETNPSLKNVTNGIFHGMLFTLMDHSDWSDDKIVYQTICQDKKPAELYSAYKLLVKDEAATEYEQGVERYQSLLKLDNRERSRIISVINISGIEVPVTFDFLIQHPEYSQIADRIKKSNQLDQAEAFSLLIEYSNKTDPSVAKLLLELGNSTPKLNLVLNGEFLTALETQDHNSFDQIQKFLLLNNDPECLQGLVKSIKTGDVLQTKLILEAQELLFKESELKRKVILKIVAMDGEGLPQELTRDIVIKLTAKDPTKSTSTQIASSVCGKRVDPKYNKPELSEANQVFSKYQCGRLFREAIEKFGEESDIVKTLSRHLELHLKSSFYQSSLDSHRMRRIYFEVILNNPEYLSAYEQRLLELNQLANSKAHQEVDLFASWVLAKEQESKQGEHLASSIEDDEGQKIELSQSGTFKSPPAFRSLLIVMPLERVNQLRPELIAELAPKISDIRFADSEKFAPLKDTANNIPSDRLVLYMTGSGSHSNFLSFKMALPRDHRARKLYSYKGNRELKKILEFFNSVI